MNKQLAEAKDQGPDAELAARALEMLRESNAIENITNIDYSRADLRKPSQGHFGALMDSQSMAKAHKALTVDDLCRWQGMISAEQVKFGHSIAPEAIGKLRSPSLPINVRVGSHIAPSYDQVPQLVTELVDGLNKRLAMLPYPADTVPMVELLGDIFQQFEAIHPFVDGNGRTGRLLLNYLATWCDSPLIVIRANERPTYYPAHSSKMAMRCFLAKKIQEVVADFDGRLLFRDQDYGLSGIYKNPSVKGQIIVEWHDLVRAIEQWQK